MNKHECRRIGRRARESLGSDHRTVAAEHIRHRIRNDSLWHAAKRIALYFATEFEVDVTGLLAHAFESGKAVFVPVVDNRNDMRFVRLVPDSILTKNRYGIWEPEHTSDDMASSLLDLVLTPLVAFDNDGHRLGMGAGYYDRAFRFLRHRQYWHHPKLLGVAFSSQEVSVVPTDSWDIRLFAIATEDRLQRFD